MFKKIPFLEMRNGIILRFNFKLLSKLVIMFSKRQLANKIDLRQNKYISELPLAWSKVVSFRHFCPVKTLTKWTGLQPLCARNSSSPLSSKYQEGRSPAVKSLPLGKKALLPYSESRCLQTSKAPACFE